MQNTNKKEKKMGNKIASPSRMLISWKTVVPALAALGVGGFFLKSRQSKNAKPGMQVKQ
jgi:hypothetical protein